MGPFGTPQHIENQKKEALKLFDKAIEKGYNNAEVFTLRGSCLNDLGYYFEAINDYDKAIERSPKQGIASNYHMRSLIKDTVLDFQGSLTDIEKAIQLSKLDNDDNEFWNNHAKRTLGFDTATGFYELQRDTIIQKLELEIGRKPDSISQLEKMKSR